MMPFELEPCPFCGSDMADPEILPDAKCNHPDKKRCTQIRLSCVDCDAKGPVAHCQDSFAPVEAYRAWNRRYWNEK